MAEIFFTELPNVHMDEATPHLHLDFVPLTADGRLSAKTVLGEIGLSFKSFRTIFIRKSVIRGGWKGAAAPTSIIPKLENLKNIVKRFCINSKNAQNNLPKLLFQKPTKRRLTSFLMHNVV